MRAVPSYSGRAGHRPHSPGDRLAGGFRRARTGWRARLAVWRLRARLMLAPRRWVSPVPRALNAALAWIGQGIEAACLRMAAAPLLSGVLTGVLVLVAVFLAGEWSEVSDRAEDDALFIHERLRGGFDARDEALSSLPALRGQYAD